MVLDQVGDDMLAKVDVFVVERIDQGFAIEHIDAHGRLVEIGVRGLP